MTFMAFLLPSATHPVRLQAQSSSSISFEVGGALHTPCPTRTAGLQSPTSGPGAARCCPKIGRQARDDAAGTLGSEGGGAMRDMLVIDADGHVTESDDGLRKHL